MVTRRLGIFLRRLLPHQVTRHYYQVGDKRCCGVPRLIRPTTRLDGTGLNLGRGIHHKITRHRSGVEPSTSGLLARGQQTDRRFLKAQVTISQQTTLGRINGMSIFTFRPHRQRGTIRVLTYHPRGKLTLRVLITAQHLASGRSTDTKISRTGRSVIAQLMRLTRIAVTRGNLGLLRYSLA